MINAGGLRGDEQLQKAKSIKPVSWMPKITILITY